jgi:hypothetical protein
MNVHAQVGGGTAFGYQALEHGHQVVCGDGPSHLDGQALPGELVDDVEQLQRLGVLGLVVLEIDSPAKSKGDRDIS